MSRLKYRCSTTAPVTAPPAESSCIEGVHDGTGRSSVPPRVASTSAAAPSSRDEFIQQATDGLWRTAHRYARRRAALVRRAGGRVDQLYADELVQDALADTWIGTEVTWDPTKCSLLEHIRDLVRWRATKDLAAARRRPHVSIDWNSETITEIDRSNSSSPVGPLQFGRVIAIVLTELQRLASEDKAAQAILAAWKAGLSDRDDVMVYAGLSAGAYQKARARVTYLVQELPQSLREAATAILRAPPSG